MAAPMKVRSKPPRRRSLADQAKDALAFRYYAQGMQVREVAEAMRMSGPGRAHAAIKRGMADSRAWSLDKDEVFALIVERIHIRYAECQQIIDEPHYAVAAGGRAAKAWDEAQGKEVAVMDSGPKLRALQEQRQLDEMLGKYADVEPPSKRRVETITRDAVESNIEALEAELGRNDPANRRTR